MDRRQEDQPADTRTGEPLLRRLDRHRTGLVAGAGLLLTGGVLAVAMLYSRCQSMTASQFETQIGLADYLDREGRHDDAARLLEDIRRQSSGAARDTAAERLANTLLKAGRHAEAEGFYRGLLERQGRRPGVEINLALSLYRQGRLKEAAELYRAVADYYSEAYPDVSARAVMALERVQDELSRPTATAPGPVNP